ncbi:MAG: ATP-grasp domain-containing protein [Jatrophihabitans sp.]
MSHATPERGCALLTIYFNRTYATNAQLIAMLRANPDGRPVRVIATHVDADSPVLAASDLALPEPGPGVRGEDYLRWALAFTAEHRVDVFVPRLELAALAAGRQRFAEQGVALLAPPSPAVDLFENKAAAYADAAGRGLPVPPYRQVTDGASLLAAFDEISAQTGGACLKPVTGVGGDGFRLLTTDRLCLADVLGPLSATVNVHAVADALDAAIEQAGPIAPLLVLPVLPGPEVSVDVLADPAGKPLVAIGRAKHGRRRRIVDDPAARGIAETLVQAHQLSYLSNTQVRYWQGPGDQRARPYLLEVNTRISGGLFQTSLTGLNLPWAAVRLALGEEVDLAEPRYDIVYVTPPGLAVVGPARHGGL